ncbi:MAG: MFS transporter, partial [Frankiales bacterium]|nr:MFS transporter [Frankiales bacterium]
MRRGNALRELVRERWFPTLLTTRLVSQTGDGVFQASLASAVFFNPDHQTNPHRAATGFVVLLLPYSLVSPFAGVLLDRWRRQRVLVRANLVRPVFVLATAALLATSGARGVAFYVAALAALSVNRFYLSALSASLPHIVAPRRLVLGNSVTTTSGTLATLVGLGIGVALRSGVGKGDRSSALIAAASVAAYLSASAVAARMPASLLGPDTNAIPLRQALRGVVRGFVSGARHVWPRKPVIAVLAAMGASRFLFGLSTIGTLL